MVTPACDVVDGIIDVGRKYSGDDEVVQVEAFYEHPHEHDCLGVLDQRLKTLTDNRLTMQHNTIISLNERNRSA